MGYHEAPFYVNDLKNAFSVLDPNMFADDTNLFYTYSNIRKLFSMVNEELASINQLFNWSKLPLSAEKQNVLFFIKPVKIDIPLMLQKSIISNHHCILLSWHVQGLEWIYTLELAWVSSNSLLESDAISED